MSLLILVSLPIATVIDGTVFAFVNADSVDAAFVTNATVVDCPVTVRACFYVASIVTVIHASVVLVQGLTIFSNNFCFYKI